MKVEEELTLFLLKYNGILKQDNENELKHEAILSVLTFPWCDNILTCTILSTNFPWNDTFTKTVLTKYKVSQE